MINLKDSVVWVTGPRSMIGRAVIKRLNARGASVISATHDQCDLMDINNIRRSFMATKIDYCILLATYSGNVEFNRRYAADTYYRTAQINLNSLKFCQEQKIKKVVSVLSSCAYADNGEEYLYEDQFWKGLPNFSIEAHGLSKRILAEYGRQIARQYKTTLPVYVVVNNSYGPHDSYDEKRSKVVGSLINRFSRAKIDGVPVVECWGTGKARRSFVFCEDVGEGIVRSLESHDDEASPLNIGRDEDISIKNLAELISKLVGYTGQITWRGGSDGQLIKTLDIEKMKTCLNWNPPTSLEEGLCKTIDWYNKNILKENINA